MIEAHNADEFYELNKDIVYVTSPVIYHKHTTSKVLVMEYIAGEEIDQTDRLKELGYDLDEIALKLSENYIKQVIDDGFSTPTRTRAISASVTDRLSGSTWG